MKAPYKYPYLSIFILGYYFLEHEGYYYKLRKYIGYPEVDEINYVVSLDDQKLSKLSSASNREMLLYCYTNPDQTHLSQLNKAAEKAKVKKRSPVLFGELDCTENTCQNLGVSSLPALVYLKEGTPTAYYTNSLEKKKILKFLKNQTLNFD